MEATFNATIVCGHSLLTSRVYRGMVESAWEAAQKVGRLLPDKYGRIHFTSDPLLAAWYARLWAEVNGEEGIVVEFPAPPLDAVFIDEYGFTAGYECTGKWRTEFYTTAPVPSGGVDVVAVGFRNTSDGSGVWLKDCVYDDID